ncbi:hypothetical protein E2C01_047480 [Portunus trituberculatus]|uniref:Uncharacterized protein n=1 Tax=Portunus trituberculatus TaxID=210409 RepID=A0A5B7G8N5_PORTR|nr:hypothetical protein [Portunus trituberculatus]
MWVGKVQPNLRCARTTSSRLVGRLEEAHSPRMGLMVSRGAAGGAKEVIGVEVLVDVEVFLADDEAVVEGCQMGQAAGQSEWQ